MNPTPQQALEMLTRLERNRKRDPVAESTDQGDDHESKVRTQITKWCDDQWPKWVYFGSQTHKKSTLPLGCQDLTILGPVPICILVDTKSRSGKPSPEQRIWEARLHACGWTLHFVKTFEQFMAAVEENKKDSHG